LKILLLNQKLDINSKSMEFKLKAEKRELNEKLSAEYIPAVVYGKGIESQSLKLKKIDFEKAFSLAGESNLISLDFGNGEVKVLVKAIQRNVLKHTFSHVDFYQVNMKEKINAVIPLHFIGESKAVKELGGMLMRNLNEIEVECLPSDLVDHIDVDISVIENFDVMIQVKDLPIPNDLKILNNNSDDVVASVMEPKAQVEEEKPIEAKTEEVKDGKKEEEKK